MLRTSENTKRSGGFTAIELVVVICIFLVLLGLAGLTQSRLLPHYRLSAATRQVVTDLRMLRAKAIAQNNRFQMVFNANSGEYHAERWNPGTNSWEQYALYSRGATTVVATQAVDLPASATTTSTVTVTFEPRGIVATTGSPPIVLSVPGRTRTVALNAAGLITIS